MDMGSRTWVIEARASTLGAWREVGTQQGDIIAGHRAARAYVAEHGGMARVRDPVSGEFAVASSSRSDATLVLRPSTGLRTLGWGLVAFGAIFGLCGTAAGDLPTAIVMGLFGLGLLLGGLSQATARLDCNAGGLRYRTLRIVWVSASDIAAVTVKTVPGYGYRRVRMDVHRRAGRTVKLNLLQRPSTPANLAQAEADAETIRREFGLPSPPRVRTATAARGKRSRRRVSLW